jgi:signal transduction histidine kinase
MELHKRYFRQLFFIFIFAFAVVLGVALSSWQFFSGFFEDDLASFALSWGLLNLLSVGLATTVLIKLCFQPLGILADVIVHAGHSARNEAAPQPEKVRIARQMITTLAAQVYDMASMSSQSNELSPSDAPAKEVGNVLAVAAPTITAPEHLFDLIGLPLIALDDKQVVTAFNKAAEAFTGLSAQTTIGKPLYDSLKLAFRTDETLDNWILDRQKNAINDSKTWERVRLVDGSGATLKQFDIVCHFAKANGTKHESTVGIFDRTDIYAQDDQGTSFVALAVHELRTPLTVMRGYIEVFEDEVGPSLSPELQGFMHKMHASAQQLTAFVSNILNVARVEENQLVLKLERYSWPDIVKMAVDDLSLRAGVHGIHIELNMAANLPEVAVDRLSIHEVINNLVDNAIKYSEKSDKIIIASSINADGLIETSVQDFGIGIPTAVMPDLFQKYHRSHKSKVQVAGTGLGLYLCRAIIRAHGGNIWVRSKEGEGSIFSFTLQPFENVAHEQTNGEDGIMRGAHGWIKNHTMNRQ